MFKFHRKIHRRVESYQWIDSWSGWLILECQHQVIHNGDATKLPNRVRCTACEKELAEKGKSDVS